MSDYPGLPPHRKHCPQAVTLCPILSQFPILGKAQRFPDPNPQINVGDKRVYRDFGLALL